MNWLPIAGRELRVSARKWSTYWVRVGAATACLAVGCGYLLIASWQGARVDEIGTILFYTLTWLSLTAALSTGLFLTSDCLSEEKREGTLGLLFLTDLRGYDVAAGKLMVTSLQGFYGLLAVLPIIAITEMIGGVSSPQYWKSALALVNGLCVSLAAGMLISAVSRDSQKALAGTFLLVLSLALSGPVTDALVAWGSKTGFRPFWSLTSPGYVLAAAGAWGRSAFWQALLLNQLITSVLFAGTCWLVPRTWQERKRSNEAGTTGPWYALRYGGGRRRLARRRRWLQLAPVAWLAGRDRWQSLALWLVALVLAGGFWLALQTAKSEEWIAWNYVSGLFLFVLYLGAASQASRFLAETRRSGFLELLLTTPTREREIIGGQWRALLRLFGLPLLLLLGIQVAVAALSTRAFQQAATQVATATAAAGTNVGGTVTYTVSVSSGAKAQASMAFTNPLASAAAGTNAAAAPIITPLPKGRRAVVLTSISAAAAGIASLGNLLAICWFGMWMGLTSRTANLATLKTLLFVQVIPWFAIAFCGTFVLGVLAARGQPAAGFFWWPVLTGVIGAGLAMAKDIGFIFWSRGKLRHALRAQAARGLGRPHMVIPPPLPPPATAKV